MKRMLAGLELNNWVLPFKQCSDLLYFLPWKNLSKINSTSDVVLAMAPILIQSLNSEDLSHTALAIVSATPLSTFCAESSLCNITELLIGIWF
jgi:hypothetical protein